jgi:hypothetical protein
MNGRSNLEVYLVDGGELRGGGGSSWVALCAASRWEMGKRQERGGLRR